MAAVRGSPPWQAAPRPAWRSARQCCQGTRRCRTASASTTSIPTAARRSLVWHPIRSPQASGGTPTRAHRGTSTFLPVSSRSRPPSVRSDSPSRLPDAEHVAFAVAKPRGLLPRAPARIVARHLGDIVDGCQPRHVHLLENDSVAAQLSDRRDDVIDCERHLREGARRRTRRFEQSETAPRTPVNQSSWPPLAGYKP